MKDFHFIVDDEVIELGVKVVGVRIQGINNHEYPAGLNDYINIYTQRLLQQYLNVDIKKEPIIQGFYDLHTEVGLSRRKNAPASETLIKILEKKKEFHRINPVVDIYNIISMETLLSLGAHDIDKVNESVRLRLTTGEETFLPLGSEEYKEVKPGVYSYIDGNDVICYLEVKQINRTKITEDSEDIFFIIQGNKETSQSYVKKVAEELVKVITYYLGGQAEIFG